MENVQPYQILTPIGIALILGLICLIWGERPDLSAAIRSLFAGRAVKHSPHLAHHDMSNSGGSAAERTGTQFSRTDPVLADTYQFVPENAEENETVDDRPTGHNYSRQEMIKLLSVQHDENGDYRYSKNKIADFVGGTRADVLAEIDRYRPLPAPTSRTRPGRLERPAGGW